MISKHRGGGVLQDVRTLFDSGTTVGLTNGELLGRFADRSDRIGRGGSLAAEDRSPSGPIVLDTPRPVEDRRHGDT